MGLKINHDKQFGNGEISIGKNILLIKVSANCTI